MDNIKKKSIIYIALLITAFLLILIIIKTNIYGLDKPTRFLNDLPISEDKIRILFNNVCYVPTTLFEQFDEITQSINKNKTELTLKYGDKSIIINIKTKRWAKYDNGIEFLYITYEFKSNEYLIPAEPVCKYFGLKLEVFENGTAVRISDNKTNYTLYELLQIYNPEILKKTVDNEISAPNKNEPSNTETTIENNSGKNSETTSVKQEIIEDRLIFLTIEDAPNIYTEEILDILEEYDIKATFFLIGNNLLDNADTVRRIIIGRHSIGLHTMTHDENLYKNDFSVFINELKEENELLYNLFKIKTRLIRAPEGSSTKNFFIGDDQAKIINDIGYIIWDWNVKTPDDINISSNTVYDNILTGIKKYKIPVIRIKSDEMAVKVLPLILSFINKYEQYKVKTITNAAYEVNFAGKYR